VFNNKSGNYRPIAIATTISKVIEHCFLIAMPENITVGKWQFGYRRNLGTELAVFSVKSVVNHYKYNGSSVYACFLDASKAFDCVLHEKLCCKLLDKGLPVNVVKILFYWFKNQNYVVSWGGNVNFFVTCAFLDQMICNKELLLLLSLFIGGTIIITIIMFSIADPISYSENWLILNVI